tara:strand:- start:2992 stop:3819 length:828 start_codon:yes stop_codon:yes gene_type:complete
LSDGCQPQTQPQTTLRGDSYQTENFYLCQNGVSGQILQLNFPGSNPSLTTVIRVQTYEGILLSGLLPPGELAWEIPEEPERWEIAINYTELGLEHIWLGWDHLMFVALLVLIARTGKRTLITVTGFTLAHSLTLALSTLNILALPIPAVEAVIALSIVFLATEIVRSNKNTLTFRYPVLVASSFGLLHGFGFASVLREVGLPSTELPTALLFFNIGVEIGQIIFVLIIFGAILLLRSKALEAYRLSRAHTGIATAYPVGTIAAFWTLERILAFWT